MNRRIETSMISFRIESQLKEINIKIPTMNNGTGTYFMLPVIDKGIIVRSHKDHFTGKTICAVAFSSDIEVKDEVSKYVIQREQEILRQNLKSRKIY